MGKGLDVINIGVTSKLNSIVVTVITKGLGLVDLGGRRQLSVVLEVSGLAREWKEERLISFGKRTL